MTIPYKPKEPKIKEIFDKFVNFEKKINECIMKVQELEDFYEERSCIFVRKN